MEITIQYIISQIFTAISYILLASTYHAKNRRNVLILSCISQIMFIFAYAFLGAWSGLAMVIVALIRNIIFMIDEDKNGKREHMNKLDIIILVVLYIISIILAIFAYEGFFSLLPIFATMIYTYGVCQKNIRIYKLLGIPTEILWTCYNLYVKSIFGILLETIILTSCITGYLGECKKKMQMVIKNNRKRKKIMEKIIIEVGSTNTKIDKYDGKKMKRIESVTIEFKRNYNKQNKINEQDVKKLIDTVKEYKKNYDNVYVCGTSIFRTLTDEQRRNFLEIFQQQTNLKFEIISPEKENELTVKGTTKNVKGKVAVFVGGGGSTEIAIYEDGIKEMVNTKFGVIDIMNQFPDLAEDLATTDLETIKTIIKERLNIPKQKADILILAGGGHLNFALNSGITYTENKLYKDESQPVMMDIETRRKDTQTYYTGISLDDIRKRVSDPDWWYATRAMCAFVLVVAEEIGAKYIVPTDISMANGLI